MTHQKTNYTNKWDIMKEDVYSKKWETFYEQNKQYLNKDDKWFQTLETLKDFIHINDNKPTNDNEKSLNNWAKNNNKNYKERTQNMGDDDIYNSWNDFIKNDKYVLFYGTEDDVWNFKLKQISNFIDTNQRIPSRVNNEMEKEYYSWIANNKNYYKNNKSGMEVVNNFRRKKWEIFINKYFVKHEDTPEEIEIIVKPKQKKSAKLPKPKEPVKVETKEEICVRTKPLISQFHNKFCKMRSDNLAQHFKDVPEDFHEYHRVRDENMSTFEPENIPCNRIIKELDKIKKGRKHVVDMGCGTAKIAEYFKDDIRFQITSYDHVAINDTVQVCDISQMPLEAKTVDICIMSLALWGSNRNEYIREALRVLDENGILYVIDSTKRWSEEGRQDANNLKQLLETNGFDIIVKATRIDKWCYFKCGK
jgi:ubiquinone/menaquinone biosynthesis C-methylase UbiE